MFGFRASQRSSARAVVGALERSLAIIEFTDGGEILYANQNFCAVLGYRPEEIIGQHHTLFVDPAYADSPEYQEFWTKLRSGSFESREFRRVGKGGREVWIQASYNPITNGAGKVVRVVKQATDITAAKLASVKNQGLNDAISRVQAVIEFNTAGEVLTANANFLDALGYTIDEIRGRHHRLFVDPAEAASPGYLEFWGKLNRGEYVAAEFMRIGKGGRRVFIDASYNPIFDLNGKVVKIVKFATDVTERVRAVNAVAAGLKALADNNLDVRLTTGFVPAFEPLRLDFNASLETIQVTLVRIGEVMGAIRSGTREITDASVDLSRRTERQAVSLEETAAALDEITATVRRAAEGSRHARDAVGRAKQAAEHSGQVVKQAVEAMSGIEQSSDQIGNIIGVIDEIAFQTNLLALNAGVEAARAGEAGRGFAVVASEVRALAQRSAEAAKEIKTLISASSQQVEQGVDLVAQTGKALETIVAQVGEINGIVTDIAASAQEQASGLDQVNTAINQVDQVTQQNAAMVEETTAASQGLAAETEKLAELISQFNVVPDTARRGVTPVSGPSAHKRPPSAARLVAALKTTGRGGAARKPDPQSSDWQEF